MDWFFYAVLARFLYAITSFCDQYIVRFAKGLSPALAVIFENLAALPILIVLSFCIDGVWKVDLVSMFWLGIGGVLSFVGLFPYMRAFQDDEAYNLMPLLETMPIMVATMAYFIFGDKLVGWQWAGFVLAVFCSCLFSWDFTKKGFKLKAIGLMLLASFGFSLQQITLRYGADMATALQTTFYVGAGEVVCSLLYLVFSRRVRTELVELVGRGSVRIISVNIFQALIVFGAIWCLALAYAKAPSAGHVSALSGAHSVFVFAMSPLAGWLISGRFKRFEWNGDVKIKAITVFVMALGIGLLNLM